VRHCVCLSPAQLFDTTYTDSQGTVASALARLTNPAAPRDRPNKRGPDKGGDKGVQSSIHA